MDPRRVYRLRGTVQHYAWGSRTAIPELLGAPSPAAEPWAELWLGAHPKAPSQVLLPDGPVGLDTFVASDPEAVLGPAAAQRFGGALPFLLKVLAAEAPLSIQAHPSLEQARRGFERENRAGIPLAARERCYADANHKPELLCALSRFEALCRFRAPEEVARRLALLGAPALEPPLAVLRRRPDREALAELFRAVWTLGEADRADVLARAAAAAREAGEGDPALRWVAELAKRHPGDVGALAPLLLNVVVLEPGEAIFLPAGELHSYLGGVGIELMASSDNVLRGGLTSKHVNVPELLRTLTFRSGPVEALRAEPGRPAEGRYPAPVEEFALARIEADEKTPYTAPSERAVEILLCTAGAGRIVSEEALELARGDGVLVPAAAPPYRVEGDTTLYRATVG